MTASYGAAYCSSNDMKQAHILQQLGAVGINKILGCYTYYVRGSQSNVTKHTVFAASVLTLPLT